MANYNHHHHHHHHPILSGLVLGVVVFLLLLSDCSTVLGREIHSTDQEEKSAAAIDPDRVLIIGRFRTYYKYTFVIDPVKKVLVPRFVNPKKSIFARCRKCERPDDITKADWRRYEDAVNRAPGLWITGRDVWKCRSWLNQNPNPISV